MIALSNNQNIDLALTNHCTISGEEYKLVKKIKKGTTPKKLLKTQFAFSNNFGTVILEKVIHNNGFEYKYAQCDCCQMTVKDCNPNTNF